jgi:cytochrome c5
MKPRLLLLVQATTAAVVACTPARPAKHSAPTVAIARPAASAGATPTPPAPSSNLPPPSSNPSLEKGEKLYASLACNACHDAPSHIAPPLRDLRGSTLKLADGRQITVDADFVRDAVLEPQDHLVAGYSPTMPTYRGVVAGQKLDALVAYVMSR